MKTKFTSKRWHSLLIMGIFAVVYTITVAGSCGGSDDDWNPFDSGDSSEPVDGNEIDDDWQNWKLTADAYSWPQEKRVAEEKSFLFNKMPKSKKELISLCDDMAKTNADNKDGGVSLSKAMKQRITSPQMAAALCFVALCNYQKAPTATKEMYRWLKGPEGMSTQEWQNISRRLKEKPYITYALFDGATPLNDYKPTAPYIISPFTQVQSNNSGGVEVEYGTYTESDGVVYCKVFVRSSGADRPVPIMTKFHRASGNWFINGSAYVALTDIRTPASYGSGY